MSTSNSDKSCNFSFTEKNQQSQNTPNLTEVDPTGKTWEKHRINADKVAEYYANSDNDTFNDYAWRLKSCSEWLEFRLVPEESADTLKLKLTNRPVRNI